MIIHFYRPVGKVLPKILCLLRRGGRFRYRRSKLEFGIFAKQYVILNKDI